MVTPDGPRGETQSCSSRKELGLMGRWETSEGEAGSKESSQSFRWKDSEGWAASQGLRRQAQERIGSLGRPAGGEGEAPREETNGGLRLSVWPNNRQAARARAEMKALEWSEHGGALPHKGDWTEWLH